MCLLDDLACKQTPLSSWSCGSSSTHSDRTVYLHTHNNVCMHQQATHHRMLTHKHSCSQHTHTSPTGDRRCRVYRVAGNVHRKERQSSFYYSYSPSPSICFSLSSFCFFRTSLHQHLDQFICPKQQLSKFYCSPNPNQEDCMGQISG